MRFVVGCELDEFKETEVEIAMAGSIFHASLLVCIQIISSDRDGNTTR